MALEEHVPVLVEQVLAHLCISSGARVIDATVGAGGHAGYILRESSPDGTLLGLDADPDAVQQAALALEEFRPRFTLETANFRDLSSVAPAQSFAEVDGILMDLGLSSRQLSDASRGFSFSREGPLDMRMNPGVGQPASVLVNGLSEDDLASLIWQYGEERRARRIARSIVSARPVTTTRQLSVLIESITAGRRERIHPATRTFQALRIAVNGELQALRLALPQAVNLLRQGGRLAIISFHSLEDRLVKRFFQQEARDCICPPEVPFCACGHHASLRTVTGKPIRPGPEEIAQNPRSRSARLRVAERISPLSQDSSPTGWAG